MTSEDLISDLIYKAEASKSRQFRLLDSWQDYCEARKTRRAEILLVSSIRKSSNKLFKKYCKSVATGDTDVLNLIAYCTTLKILRFYENEIMIISEMIDEYECYLLDGNLMDFVFAANRPDNKLWDHRGI